jgi:hypothetical protein
MKSLQVMQGRFRLIYYDLALGLSNWRSNLLKISTAKWNNQVVVIL